jgi:hypothetical protein
LADFAFDAAVVAAAFLWTLAVLTECCAVLAAVVFRGAFFAAGLFFAEVEAAGFFEAVEDEVVPEPEEDEDCARMPIAVPSRHIASTATRIIVLRSGIAFYSNDSLPKHDDGGCWPAAQPINPILQL